MSHVSGRAQRCSNRLATRTCDATYDMTAGSSSSRYERGSTHRRTPVNRPATAPVSTTGAMDRRKLDDGRHVENGDLMSSQPAKHASASLDPLASAFSTLVPHDGIEIREGYAD